MDAKFTLPLWEHTMKKSNIAYQSLALAVALGCLPTSSFAEIQLNGFASIRGTSVSADGGSEPFPGYEEGNFSFKSESLFAIQARADLGEGLSATVQLYADGQNDFDVEARWAYIAYELNEHHRVSAGLLANPLFRQSEYEKVGYAHNFARLPKAVYIGFDFSTVEGIALDSQFDLNGMTANTKLLYANWEGETFFAVTNAFLPLAFENLMAANGSLTGDWWSFSGGFMTVDIAAETLDQQTTFLLAAPGIAAAQAMGATTQQVDDFKAAIQSEGKTGEYMFAAFNIDYNNWLFDVEYVDYGIQDSVNAQNKAWYAAIGRRFDSVTLTVHTEDYSRDQQDYAFLSGISNPVLLATGRTLKDAFSQREFDGAGIDLRWDFHPSAALKVDYFQGTDTRPTVGDYRIASVGVDLTF